MAVFLSTVVVVFFASIIAVFLGHVNYISTGFGNNQYGVKTAYFWTYPQRRPIHNDLMRITHEGRTCEAVHFNLVARHGARYTSAKHMRSFTELQRKLRNNFTNNTFGFINDWVNPYPEDKAELQTYLGEKEMSYLGKVFGKELHDLLNGTIPMDGNPLSARFAATWKIRTQESAEWFYRGLTNALHGQQSTNLRPEVRDDVLRFHDNCQRYEYEIIDMSEQQIFEHGPVFRKVVTDVTKRLGAKVSLTVGDIKTAYILCATELGIMNKPDWCKLFTDGDREVLEYNEDIKEYITRLYGHDVTGQMSCPLGRDIFTAMDDAITANDKGSSYTKGMFQFGHSDTVIDLAAGLGLFKDTKPLTADNYDVMKNRAYRASIQNPFSTHFAFILYNCGGSGIENYALRLLFNEKPLAFPTCNSDICWYKQIRDGYKVFVDDCDWHSVCEVGLNSNVVR